MYLGFDTEEEAYVVANRLHDSYLMQTKEHAYFPPERHGDGFYIEITPWSQWMFTDKELSQAIEFNDLQQ